MIIGSEIRRMRKEAGISVRTLAKRTGVSPTYISFIENGKTVPTADMAFAIEIALKIGKGELLEHLEPPKTLASDERELILSYRRLDEEQKDEMFSFMRNLAKKKVTEE